MTKQASRVRVGRGFPKQMTMTHVYEDVITLTSVGGIIQTYLFSANGMYDPNITATGHQPYYFDQMTALYNHYTVIGSKAEFEYVPTTVTEESCKLGASIQDDAGLTVTTPEQLDEFPQGTMKLVAPSTMGGKGRITLRWGAKKFFGGSVLSNVNLQGTASANPTEQSYYMLALQHTGATADVSLAIKCKITYIAVWKEIKEVATS